MSVRRSRTQVVRALAASPRGLAQGTDPALVITGRVEQIDNARNRLLVSFKNGAGSWVAMLPNTYMVGRTVQILVNPYRGGRPELVLGPVLPPASTPSEDDTPTAPPLPPSTSATKTVTITPTWSGTYRSVDWDRWNVDEENYGGRSTLYQGDPSALGWGGSACTGLAVFGDQIVNLNPTTITAMVVTLRGADLQMPSYPSVTVRASSNGTKPAGAPSTAGTTSTGNPGRKDVVKVPLDPSVFASFAAGTYKGIALVGTGGAAYNAVRGTSAADGMALKITFTTPN